ncbi:hypothetical protein BDV30DRAFT_213383 [Aspergillus minisclerotigenes]|uniref:Uncharacterized protein n=1 Tax=Aspergillus minisclerotigenes TaxID=656917 RepID=A0A5N6IZY6_9EURO|nr:hypothetical protein BDV30DRAFT_213383 [Aspergillus minisclerotigenes]
MSQYRLVSDHRLVCFRDAKTTVPWVGGILAGRTLKSPSMSYLCTACFHHSPAVIVGIEAILDQFLCCTAATVPLSQQRAFRVSKSTGLLSPGASATGGNGRGVSPH